MIVVTFQHPNPYFDDSYAVNSVNVGPYGDAIHAGADSGNRKALPQSFGSRGRACLSGGSTGGWESLALQIFHPDFFGGTWTYCPDSVDFSDVEGVNVYKDKNAFYKEFEWRRVPTINSREINGQIRQTSEERNRFELVNGTHGRSGEQIDIWSAVFGPLGEDGYFDPLFDKTNRRHESARGRVLEGELRPALSPREKLVHAGTETGGQNPCVRRRRG